MQIPAARLPFVRENYQCFSVSCLHHLWLQPPSRTVAAPITYGCSPHHVRLQVSCLREGGVRDGQPCPVLYENEPGPVAEVAWAEL